MRKVITEVSDEITKSACASVDQQDAEIKQKLKEAGVQFLPISTEFKSKLDEMLKDVAAQWAKGLDSRGRKGSAALAEFRQAAAER